MKSPIRLQESTEETSCRFLWRQKPHSLADLASRAEQLAGLTLGELAADAGERPPLDLRHAKGWVGTLVEGALGASAGSRAEPDFPALGVELKTLPVDQKGKPLESTFVCTIELSAIADSEWQESRLVKKLNHVLWVPVEGTRSLLVAERRVGTPFFWQPSEQEWDLLRADWEELSLLIAQGRTSEITGHLGQVLQVRPKAARGASRRRTTDEDGALYDEQPKGFYLRARFTRTLVERHFALAQ